MIKHACLVTEQRKEWHGHGHEARRTAHWNSMHTDNYFFLPFIFFFFDVFFPIPSIVPILLRVIIMIKDACLVTVQRKEWHGECRHLWECHRTRHEVKLTTMPACKHVELPPNKRSRIWWPPGRKTAKSIMKRSIARKEKVYWSDYFTQRSHSARPRRPDRRGLGVRKWMPS